MSTLTRTIASPLVSVNCNLLQGALQELQPTASAQRQYMRVRGPGRLRGRERASDLSSPVSPKSAL